MDLSSTMLWNFEEGIGDLDSLGTSSTVSDSDPISMLLTSINRTAYSQTIINTEFCDNSMLKNDNSTSSVDSQGINTSNVLNVTTDPKKKLLNLQKTNVSNRLTANSLFCGDQISVKCPICLESFCNPKVLACFHSFCKSCLERQLVERQLGEMENSAFKEQRKKHFQAHIQVNRKEDDDPPGEILFCPLCHVETQLSFQLGIDGLLSDYGLMNAVNAKQHLPINKSNCLNSVEKNRVLIFGSPSSTSSSPTIDDLCNQIANENKSSTSCTCCKSDESASAFCNTCSHFLCVNCSFAHRYMICFEGHHVEDLPLNTVKSVVVSSGFSSGIGSSGASGGDSSSGTSPPNQNVTSQSVDISVITTSVKDVVSTINDNSIKSSTENFVLNDCNLNKVENIDDSSSHCKCLEHRSQPLQFFCMTCNLAICRDCTLGEHIAPMHDVDTIDNVAEKQINMMETLINDARNKQSELHELFRLIDADQNRLNESFQNAQNNIDESANYLIELVQDTRKNFLKELENAFGYKQLHLTIIDKEVQKMTKKMSQTIDFTQRLLRYSSPTEIMVFKPLLDSRIQGFLNFNADASNFLHNSCEIETQPLNFSQARQTIFSLMSSIQSTAIARAAAAAAAAAAATAASTSNDSTLWSDAASLLAAASATQQQTSLQVVQDENKHLNQNSLSPTSMLLLHQRHQSFGGSNTNNFITPLGRFQPESQQIRVSPSVGNGNFKMTTSQLDTNFLANISESDLNKQRSEFGSCNSLGAGNTIINTGVTNSSVSISISNGNSSHLTVTESNNFIGSSAPASNFLSQRLSNGTSTSAGTNSNMVSIFNQYEKWSSGLDPSSLGALSLSDPDTITDLSILANAHINSEKLNAALGNNNTAANAFHLYTPRSQIKRQKMTYHCKFGEFGVMEGQFTEPSGVAVNAQNDIIVADTNNHRIQVFDKEGRFKFQFGECGKRDGQLLYPNRVSVNRVTGDFIVTERSPTHQIQIYNQYGNFVRKFGANILQHPRGVCVDNQGRIIVVECKVMRVIIFDAYGNVIHKFSCSRYLEFPNGVCTNEKNEILISDNRAHCIKVFNYEGHYVRQIGGEGITNYPIGVGINASGEVIVADNHNNFNLTVFSQDGTMLNALESKVKHAQCFDVALVEDGSVVLASKDYRLYLYRYQSQSNQQLGL